MEKKLLKKGGQTNKLHLRTLKLKKASLNVKNLKQVKQFLKNQRAQRASQREVLAGSGDIIDLRGLKTSTLEGEEDSAFQDQGGPYNLRQQNKQSKNQGKKSQVIQQDKKSPLKGKRKRKSNLKEENIKYFKDDEEETDVFEAIQIAKKRKGEVLKDGDEKIMDIDYDSDESEENYDLLKQNLLFSKQKYSDSQNQKGEKMREYEFEMVRQKQERAHNFAQFQKPGKKQKKSKSSKSAPKKSVAIPTGQLVHVGTVSFEDQTESEDQKQQLFGKQKQQQLFESEFTFEKLGIEKRISEHLLKLGYKTPTAIQQKSIPALLQRKTVLIRSPTGTGKTLCYCLPIIQNLALKQPSIHRSQGTFALIICPTRELCVQVCDTCTTLAKCYIRIICGQLIGGENRTHQKARIKKGLNIVVGTPGRIADHLKGTQNFEVANIQHLVLDEGDKILEMGYERQVKEIVETVHQKRFSIIKFVSQNNKNNNNTSNQNLDVENNSNEITAKDQNNNVDIDDKNVVISGNKQNNTDEINGNRNEDQNQDFEDGGLQTILCSATMSKRVAGLAGLSLNDSLLIDFSAEQIQNAQNVSSFNEEKFEIPQQLQQKFIVAPSKLRLVSLIACVKLHMLKMRRNEEGFLARIVVFLSSCDAVEFHHLVFTEIFKQICGGDILNCPIYKLHGDMNWGERVQVFVDYCKNEAAVLFCTDVAARGLDFPAISLIIQFDPPGKCEDYVHRVGRTARIGHAGESLLFLLKSEMIYLSVLKERGIIAREVSLLEALDTLPLMDTQNQIKKPANYHPKPEQHYAARVFQSRLCQAVADNAEALQLASDSFRSYLRAYAHHGRAVQNIFNIKQLHLGHVAHSFALKERPTTLGSSASKEERKRRKEEYVESKRRKNRKAYFDQVKKIA